MGKKKAIKAEAVAEAVADATDEDSKELARNLIDDFQKWETTREYAQKERKRCNDNVSAKLAALKEGMEVGHNNEQQQILKLTVVEERWQDLEEARVERKELMSSFKDQLKLCETRIRERIAVLKSPQLGLFSSSTIDNPPTPEDDEPEPDDDPDDIDPTDDPDWRSET